MARVRLSKAARSGLLDFRGWLRREAGDAIAEPWIDALLDWMFELSDFPERGTPRPDLGAKLRTRVFRKSVTIAYVVDQGEVTILGVFARGRNITSEAIVPEG